ncbi:hypothetical protein CGRA01v4_00755 [Colletotrichum graminicola]|nr:hypothetical protein CGRA01v4_00755 [Colletotrichum graminicola]
MRVHAGRGGIMFLSLFPSRYPSRVISLSQRTPAGGGCMCGCRCWMETRETRRTTQGPTQMPLTRVYLWRWRPS